MNRPIFVSALVSGLVLMPLASVHAYNPKDADARHCLDRPTNAMVIKCAERYLSPQAKVAIAARSQMARAPKATISG